MRCLLILAMLTVQAACAQPVDPDQNPYWTRYTFVEDSSALVPLKGDYRVYYIQSGMWWSYMVPEYPMRDLTATSMRLLPLFAGDRPAFMATPARGLDYPQVRLVVVRGLDTMVVELTTYFYGMSSQVADRCERTDCRRRPPVVLPFRPGRYIGNGAPFGPDGAANPDPRTTELTALFDALWRDAMEADGVIPQLNTDTCHREVQVPADLHLPETKYRDVWLLRSPYCGTHFVNFPLWGAKTAYTITFNPYQPDQSKEPVTLDTDARDDVNYWLDISDWPVGDHTVVLVGDGNSGTFTLMLR
jgi:hypothetical protein